MKRALKKYLLPCLPLVLIFWTCIVSAQTVQIGQTVLTERDVATGLLIPWEIIYGPDDHLWITEKAGTVIRVNPATTYSTKVLDLTELVSSSGDTQEGMLGLALHPDFNNSPQVFLVYCYFDDAAFSVKQRLVSYDWDGAMLVNENVLLDDIPSGSSNVGCRIVFGPDQKLYMSIGDAGDSGDALDMEKLTGKILRMNMDGSIPSDNPFPGSRIYSFGHRNPQGLGFGPGGQLYSSEHGAQSEDEFNLIVAGGNYAWPYVQGYCDDPTETPYCELEEIQEPLRSWSPCPAVSDIVFYDHPAIPDLNNSFLLACLGGQQGGFERISQLKLNIDGSIVNLEIEYFTQFGRIRDVAINPYTGAIYFATNGSQYPGNGPNRIVEYANLEYSGTTLIEKDFMQIYPNPAKEFIEVKLAAALLGASYELFTAEGKSALQGSVDSEFVTIPVASLTPGTYYLTVSDEIGRVSKQVIIK